MILAFNKKRCTDFPFETRIHFRRKTDFFPEEDTTMSYSGFEPEPTRLQAEVDEAHFWLNGYVNKQNCRIWSEANPQVYVETPLHPETLTVWCALWAGGIIGPYFFKTMKATTLQSMVIGIEP
ncbi:putative transposable element [Trichonephila clavipes]|nr:putative transposable element [Trichonephila clavipes]